jgi:hypothetical protein
MGTSSPTRPRFRRLKKRLALSGDSAEAVRPKDLQGRLGDDESLHHPGRSRGLRFPQDNGLIRITPISR